MRKLTKRVTSHKKKVKLPHDELQGIATDERENTSVLKNLTRKPPLYSIRNESESWAEQSGTTTLSWPEDMEEVATKRVTQQWNAVERTLYDENEQLPLGPAFDECLQWQNQLPHLRIVGKNHQKETAAEESAASNNESTLKRKQQSFDSELNEEEIASNNNFLLEESEDSGTGSNKRAREEIVDELMEYVNSALIIREDIEEENMLSHDLEELLTITPAPTNNFRSTLSSHRQIHHQKSDSDRASAKPETETKDSETSFWNRRTAISARYPTEETGDEPPNAPQISRNKAGTIFNEKIVVSPVPFVRTMRESFCTLETAPIQILGQSTSTTWNRVLSRNANSERRQTSGRKTSLMRGPQVHSAWQPPVCPTIWPKNVRLAPIDSSRLPNSKQRTISTATPQRGRGSLSPIPQTTLPISLQKSNTNPKELLEIHGTHILGQSQKYDNELKTTNFNQTPKQKSSGRKKARHKIDNV